MVDGTATKSEPPPCKFTYIDKSGHVIGKMRFDGARDYSEGLAPVQVGDKWGFVDKVGTFVISPRFDDAQPFSDGLARIFQGDRYGYVDHSGAIVIGARFAHAEDFRNGLAVVGDDNDDEAQHWYIKITGEQAFPGKFPTASSFFKGLAHVEFGEGAYAYIDTKGKQVFRYIR
jgi:hypothetical protein